MHPHPPPPIPAPPDQLETYELPLALDQIGPQDPASSPPPFNVSDFLDFSEEGLSYSFPQSESEHPAIGPSQLLDNSGGEKGARVRKRDPRLVCSNFLAGRIPCACPELDEKLDEEGSGLPGRKRTRTRPGSGAPIRCQVPECEADISELKGYHRRHRVCLGCANATTVVLDGESKRYCQQCGKFHVLSDFDEGKRSCRRKLERHNNRRRRKSNDPKQGTEKEPLQINSVDCGSGDDETGKDGASLSSQIEERETFNPDGQFAALCSYLSLDNPQTDSAVQFTATGEASSGDRLNPNYTGSLSDYDNKSTYTSLCPSGRISFKLYDWNPAEFPRRLRHQIFQWLASMPVELEGYIRPGCTILTAFIAMPKTAWNKLLEEPDLHIKHLVSSPGSVLSGRDTMHVYLNDMIFRVARDAISVVKIKVMDQAPKLHYIYPTCFEVGKPMDFVACGTNLLQPNFRFLISLAGRYLAYSVSVSSMKCEEGEANRADYQLLKIHVPQVNMDLVGAAFVEVENQSGLSNFVPILICDREIFSEMNILQRQLDIELPFQDQKLLPSTLSCEVFASRHRQLSEFILDVVWFLRRPVSEQLLTSTHIERLNNLLNFLIKVKSNAILEKVLCSLKYSMDNNLVAGISDSEIRFLREKVDIAQSKLAKKLIENYFPAMYAENGFNGSDTMSLVPAANQGVEKMVENVTGLAVPSPSLSPNEDATMPLLKRDAVIMNVNIQNRTRESCNPFLVRTGFTSRHLIMVVVGIAVCCAICAVSFHPKRVSQIAMSILRCFSDGS